MVEAVTRSKGLLSLAREVGFRDLLHKVHLGTDSNAAKSFVCRRGLGRMKHLEIRDLWLQKEVRDGSLDFFKIPGTKNPSDLMTKILGVKEIKDRLDGMNLEFRGEKEALVQGVGTCGEPRGYYTSGTFKPFSPIPIPIHIGTQDGNENRQNRRTCNGAAGRASWNEEKGVGCGKGTTGTRGTERGPGMEVPYNSDGIGQDQYWSRPRGVFGKDP